MGQLRYFWSCSSFDPCVPNHSVQINRMEGALPVNLNHPSPFWQPEEDDVITGFHHACWVEIIEIRRFPGQLKNWKWPKSELNQVSKTSGSCFVVRTAIQADGRVFSPDIVSWHSWQYQTGYGDPPQLTANASPEYFPSKFRKTLVNRSGTNLNITIINRFGGCSQRIHLHKPLARNKRFNNFPTSLRTRDFHQIRSDLLTSPASSISDQIALRALKLHAFIFRHSRSM